MSKKSVYFFGNKTAEGNGNMRELLGGKGANLAEMNLLGIPVPPGFTISTEICTEYFKKGRDKVVAEIKAEVEAAMKKVEKAVNGPGFGDPENPLLVSVRSGSRASMPLSLIHISEPTRLLSISYAVFCLKKKKT